MRKYREFYIDQRTQRIWDLIGRSWRVQALSRTHERPHSFCWQPRDQAVFRAGHASLREGCSGRENERVVGLGCFHSVALQWLYYLSCYPLCPRGCFWRGTSRGFERGADSWWFDHDSAYTSCRRRTWSMQRKTEERQTDWALAPWTLYQPS